MSDNNDIQHKALKVIILSQLLLEAMDDIKQTTLYSFKLKQSGNRFTTLLEKIAKQTDLIYNENPTLITNIYNQIDGLVESLSKLDVEGMVTVGKMSEDYLNNQEEWDAIYDHQLKELNG